MNIELAAEQLIQFVLSVTALPAFAPAVALIVGFVKRLPFLSGVSAGAIHVAIQVVVWVAYTIAIRAGIGEVQFASVVEALTTILTGIGMIALGTASTQRIYESAKAHNVPVIGTSRERGAG